MENKFNLPSAIYKAIANDPYSKGDSDFSTTELISPPQIVALRNRYSSVLTEDASERLWALVGQSIHAILERSAGSGAIIEKRYFADVLGSKISGQVDVIENGELGDYKVTSVYTYIYGSRTDEWEKQAAINTWLAHKNGVEIKSVCNYLLLRDWVKSKAGTGNYPEIQFVRVPLKLWPIEQAERYVYDRVHLHQEAQKVSDEELASKFACSDEERWWNEKKGEFMRCQSYCISAQKCQQLVFKSKGE